jgi:hypothetical protein
LPGAASPSSSEAASPSSAPPSPVAASPAPAPPMTAALPRPVARSRNAISKPLQRTDSVHAAAPWLSGCSASGLCLQVAEGVVWLEAVTSCLVLSVE